MKRESGPRTHFPGSGGGGGVPKSSTSPQGDRGGRHGPASGRIRPPGPPGGRAGSLRDPARSRPKQATGRMGPPKGGRMGAGPTTAVSPRQLPPTPAWRDGVTRFGGLLRTRRRGTLRPLQHPEDPRRQLHRLASPSPATGAPPNSPAGKGGGEVVSLLPDPGIGPTPHLPPGERRQGDHADPGRSRITPEMLQQREGYRHRRAPRRSRHTDVRPLPLSLADPDQVLGKLDVPRHRLRGDRPPGTGGSSPSTRPGRPLPEEGGPAHRPSTCAIHGRGAGHVGG